MDERLMTPPAAEHQPPAGGPATVGGQAAGSGPGDVDVAPGLDDPRLLQLLSTEHWSLLSARSLVYNEAFARAGMFLTFLSASLVALAFVANAMAFDRDFLVLAAALLGLDLVIGLATVGRILEATLEDLRAIHGMNRIRNAYAQIAPQVLPFLVTSIHDDAAGVLATYGEEPVAQGWLPTLVHGLTTASSMIGIIDALLAGAIGSLVAVLAGAGPLAALVMGAGAFVVLFVAISRYALRTLRAFEAGLESRFPTPGE